MSENNAFDHWYYHGGDELLEHSIREAFEAGQAAQRPTPSQEVEGLRAQLAALRSIDNASNEWRDAARRWRKEAEAARKRPKEEPLRDFLNELLDYGLPEEVAHMVQQKLWDL